MARVFLCHNHKDKIFARRIGEDLRQRGIRVWIDEAELQVGDSLIRKIETAIAETDYLAAIISKNSITSEWVTRELEIAINREIHNKRLFVLPLIIDDCDVPVFLTGRLFADFRDPEYYEENLAKILQRLGAQNPVPPANPAPNDLRPFAIPVHAFRGDTNIMYHYIGSIPSNEDGLYVNMVYFTMYDVYVDLLIPGSVYDAYRVNMFDEYNYETGMYSDSLGWLEISFPRNGKTPQDVERICLSIIEKHNEELRWLLYFSTPRKQNVASS